MSTKFNLSKYAFKLDKSRVHFTVSEKDELKDLKKNNGFVPMEPKMRGIPEKWAATKGKGVKVAVLDTGIDLNHVDLKDAIIDAIDFTGEGIQDENGHGTHVCGIIAAREDGSGILGIAPECLLLVAKVVNSLGFGTLEHICKGIDWAVKKGADIINLSINGYVSSQTLNKAINYAVAKGVIVICSAGNDGGLTGNQNGLPAGYGSVITVAAHDRMGKPCNFSSVGGNNDFMAPGTFIWSTFKDGGYACLSGTSFSSAFVSGLAALIVAKHRLDPESKTPIENTYDMKTHLRRMSANPGHRTMEEGYGLIIPLRYADTSIVMVKDSSITVEMVKDSSITAIGHVEIDGVGYTIFYRDFLKLAA